MSKVIAFFSSLKLNWVILQSALMLLKRPYASAYPKSFAWNVA